MANAKQQQQYLIEMRASLEQAMESGDEKRIALATAYLGTAFFRVKKYAEGLSYFDTAVSQAKVLNDPILQAQCLGLKTLACQNAERLPEAFKAAEEVEKLADEHEDWGLKCDALASKAQILLDSGDEIGALSMFNESLAIAQRLADKRREMNVLGALGNYSLKMVSLKRGESYFQQAAALAREIEDRPAEMGFLGNLGNVLEWTERYEDAEKAFLEVLVYAQDKGDKSTELQVVRHLIKVYEKLNKYEKAVTFARQGIPLAENVDKELLLVFSKSLIAAYYQLNQIDGAHEATKKTIAQARSAGQKDEEASFLLSLAESYLITEAYDEALETYLLANKALQRRSRLVDVAHVTGRLGMVLAELGRVDEAIPYHQEAINLARERELPGLEGEQFTMLAMAYREGGELEQARLACETAVSIYTNADLHDNANKAQILLAEIGKEL